MVTQDELALARMDDDGFGCAIMTDAESLARAEWRADDDPRPDLHAAAA